MAWKALPFAGVTMIVLAIAITIAGGGYGLSSIPGLPFSASRANIGMDRAVTVAESVAGSHGSNLGVDEVIEFSLNYYASIRERDTGIGAFEILIDKSNGATMLEPPSMMWNTKYGMMAGGGMRGFGSPRENAPMTVSSDQSRDIAQRWLDVNRPDATGKPPDPFYGYYTVDFEKAGKLAGMLSVNGFTGQVWNHTWHGSFTQSRDLADLSRAPTS